MVDKDDEALERMRAADPAVGSHPDLSSLRRRLSRSTPLGLTGAADDDRAVRVGDGTTRGSRASIAAAAAVVAIGLGVGGYTLGAQTAGPEQGGTTVAGTPTGERSAETEEQAPELLGTSESDSGAGMASSGGDDAAIGGGEEGASSMAAGLPVVLTPGSGLSTSGGTAEVKAVTPVEVDLDAFLGAWAAELGLEGTPEGEGDYRSLSQGSVTISVYGGSYPSFDYMDLSLDPYCADQARALEEERAAGGDVELLPAPVDCPEPSGEQISEDQALQTARDFLAGAGIDLAGYELQVEQWGGPEGSTAFYVNGTATDSELPDSQWLSVTVTPDGVANANGQLGADLTSMGQYPVVSPVEAVERLGDPRYLMWGSVYVADLGGDEYSGEWVEPDWPAVDRTPGAPIPFWVREGTVVEAELSEGMLSLPSGAEFLVPAYVLTDDLGQTHTMVALADEALDFTP